MSHDPPTTHAFQNKTDKPSLKNAKKRFPIIQQMTVGDALGWSKNEPAAFGDKAESLFFEKTVRFKGQMSDSISENRYTSVAGQVERDCQRQDQKP